MTTIINSTKALELLREEMYRRGAGYTYNDTHGACRYRETDDNDDLTDEAACIAGGALINGLGLKFEHTDGAPIEGPFEHIYRDLEEVNDVKFTPLAVLAIRTAQAVQDNGGTHGEAVSVAFATVETASYLGSSDEVAE